MAIAWLPGPAGTRRRVAKPSVEEPDAAEPARPDLWGARVSNDPGLPDPREWSVAVEWMEHTREYRVPGLNQLQDRGEGRMIQSAGGTPAIYRVCGTVHLQEENHPRTSSPKAGPAPLREDSRHRRADLESPGVSVKALGRSATSHDNHAARQRTRCLPRGGRGDVHKSRRTKAWFDREAQPEERTGTLRKDMLERLLWFTPQGGKGKARGTVRRD